MTKKFASNLLTQGSIEQDNLSKKCEKFLFLGNLIKISILVLNLSTKSGEKPMLFLIAIYPSKNDNKPPLEMRN